MSEVKRYHVTEAGLVEGSALGRINVVLGADFDQVTARLKEGITKHWQIVCDQRAKIDALQALLTAADERADVLETEVARLNRVKLSLKELADSRSDNCSVYRHHLTEALTLAEKVRDASLGMQRKYLSDLIDSLKQSSGAALKPAEAARCANCDRATVEQCDDAGCGFLGAGNGAPE